MIKLIKIVATLLLVLVTIVIGLTMIIDPNDYKQQISSAANKLTNSELVIDGNISWSIFPELGFSILDTKFNKQFDIFNTDITIKQAIIKVDLINLIIGKGIKVNGINLSGLNADITKLALESKTNNESQSGTTNSIPLRIDNLVVSNSSIRFNDNNNQFELRDVNLRSNSFSMEKIEPISFSGKFSTKDLTLSIKADISGTIDNLIVKPVIISWNSLELNNELVITNLSQSPKINGKTWVTPTNAYGLEQLSLNLNYMLSNELVTIEELNLASKNSKLIAKATLNLKNNISNINIESHNLNLAQLAGIIAASNSNKSNNDSSIDMLRNLNLQLKLNASNTRLTPNITLNNLQLDAIAKQGIVDISPIKLDLFNSIHNAKATLNVNGESPKFRLQDNVEKFDLVELMRSFGKPEIISGNTKLDLEASSHGYTLADIKRNLSGDFNLTIQDGIIYGIDIGKILEQAEDTLNDLAKTLKNPNPIDVPGLLNRKVQDWRSLQPSNPQTAFNLLATHNKLKNGISNHSTMALEQDSFKINGKGKFDLNQETINYLLHAQLLETKTSNEIARYLLTTPLPISISGSLYQPSIKPDLNSYLKQAIYQIQKSLIKNATKKLLNNVLGNDKESNEPVDLLKSIFK